METGAALEIMEIAGELLERVHRLVWGPGLLILMLGTGILYTGKSKGFQIFAWKVWWSGRQSERETGIPGFQTACTALAATIGTGNIVGVATALKAGGPGSCFLDVDLGAFGNDDRICGGVAGNPLPLPE